MMALLRRILYRTCSLLPQEENTRTRTIISERHKEDYYRQQSRPGCDICRQRLFTFNAFQRKHIHLYYLILALIRYYMEFQQHFIQHIEPNKQLSIDDFFVQILQWRKSDHVGITRVAILEMTPEKDTKRNKTVKNSDRYCLSSTPSKGRTPKPSPTS